MDFNDILSFTGNALRIIPPTTNRHVPEKGGECIFNTVCSKGLAIQRFFSAITVPTVQADGVCALSFSTTVQYRIEPGVGGEWGGGGCRAPVASSNMTETTFTL